MDSFKKILLVDDDNVSNYINKALIETMQITHNDIEVATNGRDALNFVKQSCMPSSESCPTLILLDLKMPVMDGFEFLEEFSTLGHQTVKPQIFLLTSSSNPKDIERAEQFNISGYLSKPLTIEKLKDILK